MKRSYLVVVALTAINLFLLCLITYNSSNMADFQLDCRNLNCPMPIVKIARQMKKMEVDQTLEVVAKDPAFKADVEAWIRKTGNIIVSFEDGEEKKVLLQKVN